MFQQRFQYGLSGLGAAIDACQARGLRVALLEMPLNVAAVGHDFDGALTTYRKACRDLAGERGIPYLNFVSGAGLKATDFFDLQHLLPPGRAKWQRRLSVELLRKHLI